MNDYRQVLAHVSDGEQSNKVLNCAARVAAALGASLRAVHAMAQVSGQTLNTIRLSQGEVLGASIAEAAVPDCLRADTSSSKATDQGVVAGGGLLALPGLIYAAATGKCKP